MDRKTVLLRMVAALLLMMAIATAGAQRKRVAVVLSGGGAKGVAHIGALKVIERAGIPIDYIVGTSMGSIVGGLYSIGYDAQMLDSVVREQDWKFLLSDQVNTKHQSLTEKRRQGTYIFTRPIIRQDDSDIKGGFISGHNLQNLFSRLTVGYHDSIDFSNLPIPFACVATNMVDFTEIDIHSGWLSQAMRASMAIPGVFTPVRIDSMVLVDGGLKNNYPVDVARRMGADVIIGVMVPSELKTASQLKSGSDILRQLIDFNTQNKYDENVGNTDIPIKVNVNGYSSASFSKRAIDTLIRRGEEAAMLQWDSLLALKHTLGIDSGYVPQCIHRSADGYLPQRIKIAAIDFDNVAPSDRKYICRKFDIYEGDSVSSLQLEQAMVALRSNMMYASAEYTLRQMPGGYWLRVIAGNRKITEAHVGVRFDTEEIVAMQAATEWRLPTRLPVELSATARFGKRYMGRLAATFMPVNFKNWTVAYTFRRNDINLYSGGKRDFNVTYNYHALDATIFSLSGKNYGIDLTARWENYNFEDVLSGIEQERSAVSDEHLYSARFRLHYDSEDDSYFATRGARLEAGYGIYTDNFASYRSHFPLQAIDGRWRVAMRLSNRLTMQPTVYGRIVWGKEMPWCMSNFIGGDFAGHYVEQQLPFAGIGQMEYMGDAFVAAGLKLQQKVVDNNYVILRAAFSLDSEKARTLHQGDFVHGYQLSWAYNSMFGPVNANIGYSTKTRRVNVYLNFGFTF
jgi:NTE family protein